MPQFWISSGAIAANLIIDDLCQDAVLCGGAASNVKHEIGTEGLREITSEPPVADILTIRLVEVKA